MELQQVRAGFLATGLPPKLVDELLDSYVEAKRRFHLGDHRPQEVEGGRFSEAVFRVLQHLCGATVTPIGMSLPGLDRLLPQFEAALSEPDAVRLHIPRTLKLIYDVRNKRDAAHLADGIDPNLQDATLVVANMDWVVAELIRLKHQVSANEAQRIIEEIVRKDVPAIQEIDGQPVILADHRPREQALLMLYRAGPRGLTLDELVAQLRVSRKNDLKKRLNRLDEERLVLGHPQSHRFHITAKGGRYVEKEGLAQPV